MVEQAITRAEAHVRARVAAAGDGEPEISRQPAPCSFTAVRAAVPGAYPGTGVAVAVVSPGGQIFGTGTDTDLGALLDAIGPQRGPTEAMQLAQLIALAYFDGLVTVIDQPAPALRSSPGGEVVLEAQIRGAMDPEPERLSVTFAADGSATIDRAPLPAEPEPIPIDRATALERALAGGQAMAIQTALRAMSGTLSERDMTAIARVAIGIKGPIGMQAKRRLGDSPAAHAALERAKSTP